MVTELQEVQKAYDRLENENKDLVEAGLKLEALKVDGLDNCASSLRYAAVGSYVVFLHQERKGTVGSVVMQINSMHICSYCYSKCSSCLGNSVMHLLSLSYVARKPLQLLMILTHLEKMSWTVMQNQN